MKVRYVDVETPKFINDLCGGLPFYPFDQNENSWIAKYEATDLLGQIDIDELKVTEVDAGKESATDPDFGKLGRNMIIR